MVHMCWGLTVLYSTEYKMTPSLTQPLFSRKYAHRSPLTVCVIFKMPPHFSYGVLRQKFSSHFEVNMASKFYSNYSFTKQNQCRMLCKWCTVLPKICTTLLFPLIFQMSTGCYVPKCHTKLQ